MTHTFNISLENSCNYLNSFYIIYQVDRRTYYIFIVINTTISIQPSSLQEHCKKYNLKVIFTIQYLLRVFLYIYVINMPSYTSQYVAEFSQIKFLNIIYFGERRSKDRRPYEENRLSLIRLARWKRQINLKASDVLEREIERCGLCVHFALNRNCS